MLAWDRVEELHRGRRSLVTRVRRTEDGATYVLKESLLPSMEDAADALQREQRVLSLLVGCEGVIRSFGARGGQIPGALVLESFEAESLAKRLLRGRIPPNNTLTLALSILTTLGRVHARGIVHGDLCPENVLLASDGTCRLIDFASAVPIGSEAPPLANGLLDARALACAAPEQLGDARRGPARIDRRTDYYRVGALLYELLTGRPLFDGVDPEELALSHGARRPTPPRTLVPEISPALERVVLKLLEKDPDARYQSEARLRDALDCCRSAARRGDRSFDALSTAAEAPAFVPSARLFGRDAVLARVEMITERALRGQHCLVLLEGPAGMGKSTLAEEIGRRVRARQGFFVQIRFDAGHAADPGLPLQRALAVLSEQLEQLAGAHLLAVGERLEQRVPGALGALVACCPALAAVFPNTLPSEAREGCVEPVPRAFGELLRALSEQGPPVCLFVDDLQWAPESAWRAVRELLRAAERAPFALLTAHRTDEPDACQRSRARLDELTTHGYTLAVEKIDLLSRTDVRKLVVASLTQKAADLAALEELFWTWSRGHPLYAHTLLEAMAQRCIAFDAQGRPFVELGLARSLLAEGNVEALLGQRFRALPADTRYALELASCLGHSFDLAIIAAAIPGDVFGCLAPGVSAGLLAAFGHMRAGQPAPRAHFAHEPARDVVGDGLSDEDRALRHLTLGRVFLQRLSAGHERHTLFAAVEHLTRARPVLDDATAAELATLQLRATREATRAGHGDLALMRAHEAVAGLPEGVWESAPARVRALLLAQADAALAWGEPETVTRVVETLHALAIEPQHFADVLTLEGRLHAAQHREPRAAESYLQALSVLRAAVPERPSERDVALERARTAAQLANVSDEAILSRTECRDERVRRELSLLGKLMLSASSTIPAQRAVLSCRIVRSGLRHGHTPESACGYADYALLLARDQEPGHATRFARVALALAERFGSGPVLAYVQLQVSTQLLHLTLPVRRLVSPLLTAHQAALDAGAEAQVGSSAITLDFARVWSGEPLSALGDTLAEQRELLKHLKQKPALDANAAWRELVQQLREPSEEHARLPGSAVDAERASRPHGADDDAVALLHETVAKVFAAVVYRTPVAALAQCEKLLAQYDHTLWAAPLHVLEALARQITYASLPEEQRAHEGERIHTIIEKITRFSAQNPEESVPRLRLVRGLEAARVGDTERAAQLLEEALSLLSCEGPAWEAVAAECAAHVWLARGERDQARGLLRRAHDAYRAWGALGKVHALVHAHPDVIDPTPDTAASGRDLRELHRMIESTRPIEGEVQIEALMIRLSSALAELLDTESAPFARSTIALLDAISGEAVATLAQTRRVRSARDRE